MQCLTLEPESVGPTDITGLVSGAYMVLVLSPSVAPALGNSSLLPS